MAESKVEYNKYRVMVTEPEGEKVDTVTLLADSRLEAKEKARKSVSDSVRAKILNQIE